MSEPRVRKPYPLKGSRFAVTGRIKRALREENFWKMLLKVFNTASSRRPGLVEVAQDRQDRPG